MLHDVMSLFIRLQDMLICAEESANELSGAPGSKKATEIQISTGQVNGRRKKKEEKEFSEKLIPHRHMFEAERNIVNFLN